jgi:hypothetical protein
MFIRQSTAVTVRLGPAVSITDGFTPVTGATPVIRVAKNGVAAGARSSGGAVTHDENGYYLVPLDTTDTNTVGILELETTDAAVYVPFWAKFEVLPGAVYDALVSATGAGIRSDVQAIAAGAITAAVIADGAIDAATFAANAITSTVVADNTITANKIATAAITSAKIANASVTSRRSKNKEAACTCTGI